MTTTDSSAATQADIDEVERSLRAELASVTLVGEIDLDVWGPLAEEALRARVHRSQVDRIARLWPATLVTYLVYQGLHSYEDSTFWHLVTIEELRDGKDVGPQFERALTALSLSTFDDLEELEGFKKATRGRYVRRIHLHGGLPRDSVARVMELLDVTLRSGASSAPEVVDLWSGLDLSQYLRNKAAERCVLHTGDFAVTLLGYLIELVRRANRGDLRELTGIPSHLIDGVEEYRLSDRSRHTWEFVEGARVCIDPHRGEPFLRVPQAYDVAWIVDGIEVGVSSRQVREQFPLPPLRGNVWTVESDDGNTVEVRRFAPEPLSRPVFVFDDRGRLHRRSAPLGGVHAYVLGARDAVAVSPVVDQRSLGGAWAGFELFTVDLRGLDVLRLDGDGEQVEIPIDNELAVRVGHGTVEGITVDGAPVLSGTVTLAFDGYVPALEEVLVTGPGGSAWLHSVPRRYGEFDVTSCFSGAELTVGELQVDCLGLDLVSIPVAYVPELTLSWPRLSPPAEAVEMHLGVGDSRRWRLTVPAGAASAELGVELFESEHRVEVQVNRLEWTLEGPHTLIPLVGAEGFSIRLSTLHEHELRLRTRGVPVRVALLDGPVPHEEVARRHPRHAEIRVAQIRAFAETARAAAAPRTRVAVLCDELDPIEVGVIESRYETTRIAAELRERDGTAALAVEWEELTEWPGRQVRVWGASRTEPWHVEDLNPGVRSVRIPSVDWPDGRYLVEVVAPPCHATQPAPGATAVPVYIGSLAAMQLRQAVDLGDRLVRFDDSDLDALVPLMADLLSEQVRFGASPEQRVALAERIADDHWRLVQVVCELDERLEAEAASGRCRLDRYLIDLIPMAWVNPVTDPTGLDFVDHLNHLWSVAPTLAACLDRASLTGSPTALDACDDRWIYWAGVERWPRADTKRSLDRLAAPIPHRSGVAWNSTCLLDADAWTEALCELRDADPKSPAFSALFEHRAVAVQIARKERKRPHPRWVGVPRRVQNAIANLDEQCALLPDLVRIACEVLDPAHAVAEDRALAALAAATDAAPHATRAAVIFAAAAMRTLDTAALPRGPLS
jgi:hypothetical protein